MSENELVPQDARQMLTAALSHLGNITELTVRTDDELTAANALAGQLKMCSKELVDKRQEIVKPYKDKVSAIEVEFRDVLKKLDNGISKIGQGVGAYWAQKQAAIDAENARLAAEAEAKRRKEEEKAAEERSVRRAGQDRSGSQGRGPRRGRRREGSIHRGAHSCRAQAGRHVHARILRRRGHRQGTGR